MQLLQKINMTLQRTEEYEYKIRDEDNRKEICEQALNNISYNGEFSQNLFSIKKSNLDNTINMWKEKFHELSDELELWKHSEGNRYTKKEILRPIHRGKEIKCVFLKVFDKGEEENTLLRCVSISGDISIKVKVNRFFKLMRWASEDEKKYIKIIKSHPEVMAALIMSRRVGLKILWEKS